MLTTESNCIGSWYWNVQGPSAVISKPLDSTKGSMGGNIIRPTTKHSVIQAHGTLKQRVEKGIEIDEGADKNSKRQNSYT